MDEALGDVVVDGILGLLVKHQNETLNFLCVLLIKPYVLQLSHQLAVAGLLLILYTPIQSHRN